MRRVYTPDTESELAFIVSLLEGHGISVFVHNRGFGSLFPGVQIELYNRRSVMVSDADADEAIRLIREALLQDSKEPESEDSKGLLRMVLEMLLFGWFVPGSHRPGRTDKAPSPFKVTLTLVGLLIVAYGAWSYFSVDTVSLEERVRVTGTIESVEGAALNDFAGDGGYYYWVRLSNGELVRVWYPIWADEGEIVCVSEVWHPERKEPLGHRMSANGACPTIAE